MAGFGGGTWKTWRVITVLVELLESPELPGILLHLLCGGAVLGVGIGVLVDSERMFRSPHCEIDCRGSNSMGPATRNPGSTAHEIMHTGRSSHAM
jgi:hypothetical protein